MANRTPIVNVLLTEQSGSKLSVNILSGYMLRVPHPSVLKGAGFDSMRNPLRRIYGRGHLHFVTFSCYRRRPSLGNSKARDRFVKILDEVRARHKFRVIGYVVMPEHVHLLINEPAEGNPSKVLQVLKQKVSRALRRKAKNAAAGQLLLEFARPETGDDSFWQRRFYDFNIWNAKKVKEKLQYMHANPVKRGLVRHPRDWPWSSWMHYAKGEPGLLRIDNLSSTEENEACRKGLKKSQEPHP